MDDKKSYLNFQKGIVDTVTRHGGMLSLRIEPHLGWEKMAVHRSLKKHFDPNNIINPGGVLGPN